MLVTIHLFAILAACFFYIEDGLAQPLKKNPHWNYNNSHYKSEKFSSLDSIKPTNLTDLKPAWIFKSGFVTETRNTVQSSPVFTGTSLVTVSLDGNLIAINPATGVEKWRIKLAKPVGRRGIVFKKLDRPTLFVPTRKGVFAINELTGTVDKSIGNNGVFGTELSLFPPVITKNNVIVAHNWTGIKSYDLETGEKKWDTSIKSGNITPRIWAGYSFDKNSGLLFIVTSNPGGLIGVKRKFVKDYSSSLVAVNSKNGDIVWSFQEVVHDLWDLEMVGSPIIADIKLNGKIRKAVFSFSKTGNVIALDRLTGKSIYPDSYKNVAVPKSDVPGENASPTQKLFTTPEPISSIIFNPEKDLQNIIGKRREYILFKMRNAKTGFFIPPSLNNDIVLFGLHGGAEWPGGALDKVNNQLIVPSNRDPWILRLFYTDNIFSYINSKLEKFNLTDSNSKAPASHKERLSQGEKCSSCHSPKARWNHEGELSNAEMSLGEYIYSKLPFFSGSDLYINKCASCHGIARQGFYENEFFGDGYAPSLVGITLTKRKKSIRSLKEFFYNHKYTTTKIELNQKSLNEIRDYFVALDKFLNRWDLLSAQGRWQLLLDQDDLPAVAPPWGELTAINLDSGKINWKKPIGERKFFDGKEIVKGDINFGGVLVTASGLVFATGTPDEMVRAFNSTSGEELWSHKLPAAGSAPPMTFFFSGCQYVVVNATGGRFVGYGVRSDATVAFKLADCGKEK